MRKIRHGKNLDEFPRDVVCDRCETQFEISVDDIYSDPYVFDGIFWDCTHCGHGNETAVSEAFLLNYKERWKEENPQNHLYLILGLIGLLFLILVPFLFLGR